MVTRTRRKEGKIIGVIDLEDGRRIRLIRIRGDGPYKRFYNLEIGRGNSEDPKGLESIHRSITICEDEIEAITKLLLLKILH